jgi:sugar/nucleoside kinase (ribokinase family)
MGELAWDLAAPRGRPLEEAPPLTPAPGGGAVITALELARAGVPVALCAAVGDDALGVAMQRRLEDGGVDASLVIASPLLRTGLVLIGGALGSSRRFMSYRAPDDEARALRAALPSGGFGARLLHLSAIVPTPASIALFRDASRRARREGSVVTLDVNARPRLWRRPSKAALEILAAADWVKCSSRDLDAMGAAPADILARLRKSAVLVVTHGPGPVRAFGPFGSIERAPPALPDPAVDPTGAGDAFSAGLIAALVERAPEPLASADLAALCVERGIDAARAHLERRRASSA